jgi:hypothetical protein
MTLTDTFSSTAALTIPILMLAGTVELRGLADVLIKRITQRERQLYMRVFAFAREREDVYQQLTHITQNFPKLFIGPLKLFVAALEVIAIPGIPFLLPLAWLTTIILSGVSETFSFLYLAGGMHGQSNTVLVLSLIAIISLMVLLVLTPAIGTLYAAPRPVLRQILDVDDEDLLKRYSTDIELLTALLDVIPTMVRFGDIDVGQAKKVTDMAQSFLSRATSTKRNNNRQRRRPRAQTGLRSSSRQAPRSAAQRQIARKRSH